MLRLLHVDDDKDILEVAEMSLELNGDFQTLQCNSGKEALEVAAGFAPEVFLLDIMMPEMSGETTLSELRKIKGLETVPAIFMTARVQPYEIERYKQAGALDVIIKPFDPIELSGQVSSILRENGYEI